MSKHTELSDRLNKALDLPEMELCIEVYAIAKAIGALDAQGEAVAWMRYRNGKPDWAEDCIRSDNDFSETGDYPEEYTAIPLYTHPPEDARDAVASVDFRQRDLSTIARYTRSHVYSREAARNHKLLYGFMLDCNAVGPHGAGENLARGIKQYLDAAIPPPPAARGAGG